MNGKKNDFRARHTGESNVLRISLLYRYVMYIFLYVQVFI